MQEANNFKLGLFVTVSIVVLIFALSAMGLFERFKPKAHLVTFVTESVQGLSPGSPAKYKGVPIGNVNDISILTTSQEIRIDILIDLSKFRQKTGKSLTRESTLARGQFFAYLQKEVERGLSCRIEPDGITGAKYVEIDFFQDAADRTMGKTATIRDNILYMPSTPSMLANLRMNLLEILASIGSVNFKKLAGELTGLLERANQMLNKAEVDKLLGRANRIAEQLDVAIGNLNSAVNQERIDQTLGGVDATLESVRTFSDELHTIARQTNLPETSAAIRRLSNSLLNSSDSLQNSLQKANNAIDALTDLIQYLNENPSSVLCGKGRNADR